MPFALISLVSAGLGIGFAPRWTNDFPNRNFELRKVRGIHFRIGMGVAWNREELTASRDDIIDIARSRRAAKAARIRTFAMTLSRRGSQRRQAFATSGDHSKSLQTWETMVSRDPFRSNRPQQTSLQPADQGHPAEDAIIDQARALYGSEAATAVAYAWFENEEVEFRRFARMFRRLRN